ncbi:MAG: flagellar biosynthetic protein FliR [Mariprofundaceae bacterium]
MLPPIVTTADVIAAMLVLIRVSSMLIFLPVLGHQLVPIQAKIGLIGVVTLLIFPIVRTTLPELPVSPLALALITGQELMIGAMLALLAQLIFGAVQLAGQIMSYQMGMAIANVFDPSTSAQIAIVGQFAVILAMLMWLAAGAHHTMILALADSFTLFPMGHPWAFSGWQGIVDATAEMFVLGLRLCAPVLLLMMFAYAALGLLSRAVPQIQIFFVSFPLTIGLGLLVFALSLPAFMSLLLDAFHSYTDQIPRFLQQLASG